MLNKMNQIPQELQDSFYAGIRTELVPFVINDPVGITTGPYAGQCAAVISLETINPEVTFLVELGSNGLDVTLPVSALRHASEKTG